MRYATGRNPQMFNSENDALPSDCTGLARRLVLTLKEASKNDCAIVCLLRYTAVASKTKVK
jgi:hypothetical protein